jgi:hypothetical protein
MREKEKTIRGKRRRRRRRRRRRGQTDTEEEEGLKSRTGRSYLARFPARLPPSPPSPPFQFFPSSQL